MVRTPKTRGRGAKDPATIELGPEDVIRIEDVALPAEAAPAEGDALVPREPTPAEQRFAEQESLTPTEAAAPPEESAPEAGSAPEDAAPAPEAPEAADSFRFSESLPAAPSEDEPPPAEDAQRAPAQAERQPDLLLRDPDVEGPVPGDATTPLFAEPAPPPPEETEPPARASVAPPPPARGRGTGALVFAGVVGGVVALLLAGLLQFLGYLPGISRQTAAPAVTQAELDGLKSEIAALREAAAKARPPGEGVSPAAFDALRAEVEQLKTTPGGEDLGPRLGTVEQKVDALGARAVSADQIAALDQKAAAAEQLARGNEAGLGEAVKRVEALEGTVGAMQPKLDALAQQPRVALGLAAAALKDAFGRGAPFEPELATLSAAAPNLAQAEALQPYAAAGVPALDTIRSEWGAAAAAMRAAASPADPDSGIVDQLFSGAGSLISVEPVGAVEGTDPQAVIARAGAAVEAGDFTAALAEYDALPDPVKAAGAAWAGKARARLQAEALIDGAITEAMKGA